MDGAGSPLSNADWVRELGTHCDKVLPKGSPAYDEARNALIWNGRLRDARMPEAIATPASTAEVAAVIRFATERDIAVSPRGGGHNYEAAALKDGGIMLDLGALDGIEIDEGNRSAWVGPGVRGGDLIERLAALGLAFPIGHCPDVSLSGYLLSGGFGWNSGEWGPACESVSAVELVLASGETVIADRNRNADLFWAARGSGVLFFAAVTRFRLQLRDLPPVAWSWTATFAAESAPLLASWLDELTRTAHCTAEITCLVGPDMKTGRPAVVVRAEATGANREEARRRIPAAQSYPRDAERIEEPSERCLDFAELTRLSAMPSGKRVAADHMWSKVPIGEMLLAIHHLAGIPDKSSTVNLFGLGREEASDASIDGEEFALSLGGGPSAGIYAMWDDAKDDSRHIDWVEAVEAALAPLRRGRYVGEARLGGSSERLRECFTPQALERISQLRERYDPKGLFALPPFLAA